MRTNCEFCGGKLVFSPEDKANKCIQCGSNFPIEYKANFVKKAFSENIRLDKDELASSLANLKCKNCGANVLLNKYEMQVVCPYCNSTEIIKGKNKKLMCIDSIIPFVFGEEEAIKRFKQAVMSRFFADKRILKNINKENVKGVYVNAFVFDCETKTNYSATIVEQINNKDGSTKYIRRYVSGNISLPFINVPIEANSQLSQNQFAQILPFNYQQAIEYNNDFMNGYVLEYNDKMFDECVKDVKLLINSKIKQKISNRYLPDQVENLTMKVEYTNEKYNYCLLPVYFFQIKDEKTNKTTQLLMNGQNGEVGKLPNSAMKILLTILISIGTIGLIVVLCMFLGGVF